MSVYLSILLWWWYFTRVSSSICIVTHLFALKTLCWGNRNDLILSWEWKVQYSWIFCLNHKSYVTELVVDTICHSDEWKCSHEWYLMRNLCVVHVTDLWIRIFAIFLNLVNLHLLVRQVEFYSPSMLVRDFFHFATKVLPRTSTNSIGSVKYQLGVRFALESTTKMTQHPHHARIFSFRQTSNQF